MKKMCAPVRDDSIKALTLLKNPVDIFKGITEVNYFQYLYLWFKFKKYDFYLTI